LCPMIIRCSSSTYSGSSVGVVGHAWRQSEWERRASWRSASGFQRRVQRHPDASVRHIQNLVSAISRPSLWRILLPFSSYKRTYVYVLSKILILYTGSLPNDPIETNTAFGFRTWS
jgi:hypothetical protein